MGVLGCFENGTFRDKQRPSMSSFALMSSTMMTEKLVIDLPCNKSKHRRMWKHK